MFQGVRPFFVVTRTMPLPRSPYSALGTPVITSTLSMFSTEMLLVPIPAMAEKLALSPIRTPFTSTAVEKAALPASEPAALRDRALSWVRSGLMVFPPGRRAPIPSTPLIWRWSRAVRPIFWVVLRLSLEVSAVTTTSFRARVFSEILIMMSSMSLVTFISRV